MRMERYWLPDYIEHPVSSIKHPSFNPQSEIRNPNSRKSSRAAARGVELPGEWKVSVQRRPTTLF
jgi:hypothetical protein